MPLVVHIAAHSLREREYEEKILFDVVRETGGERIPRELEKWWEEHMDYFMIVSRLQSVLRLGGSWLPQKAGAESVQHMCDVCESIGTYIHDFTDTGKIFDAPENYQIIPMEYSHFASNELLIMWDRTDPKAMSYVGELGAVSRATDAKRHFYSSSPGVSGKAGEATGKLYSNVHVWMGRIREAFDPFYQSGL